MEEFDDPKLKQALRRALGAQGAPQSLRARIEKLAISPIEPAAPIRGRSLWPRIAWGLAAAALLALAIGNGMERWKPDRTKVVVTPPAVTTAPAMAQLPEEFALALVARHDACEAASDHHGLPGNNVPELGVVLASQLKRAVWDINLIPDGYTFHGAAECPVAYKGNIISAHLVYSDAKGDQISVMSLPASMLPEPNGTVETATVTNHRCMAYWRDGALFCMVWDTPTTAPSLDEAQTLAQAHASQVAEPAAASLSVTPQYAELLRNAR